MGFLHIGDKKPVRTNIDIDDGLMREAMRASGAATKKAAAEAGLRLLVQTFSQGKVRWEEESESIPSGTRSTIVVHIHCAHCFSLG